MLERALKPAVRLCPECGWQGPHDGGPFACPECGAVVAAAHKPNSSAHAPAANDAEPLTEAELDQLTGQVFARPEGRRWLEAIVREKGVLGHVSLSEIRTRLARERARWGQGALTPE